MTRFEAEQAPEDEVRTENIEIRKRIHTTDQAPEDPEKTKRIEELKRKQRSRVTWE